MKTNKSIYNYCDVHHEVRDCGNCACINLCWTDEAIDIMYNWQAEDYYTPELIEQMQREQREHEEEVWQWELEYLGMTEEEYNQEALAMKADIEEALEEWKKEEELDDDVPF